MSDHLDGVDVVCPWGSPVDATTLKAGTFGLVQQFGVGLEKVDVAAATELGVYVARIPGDAGGNADSVAEVAVLHMLALTRRLNELTEALRERRWETRPLGNSLLGQTVLIVGLGAIGDALAARLPGFGVRLTGVRADPERGGPPGVGEVAGPDGLPRLLGQADVVVCCAMLDEGTARMFGRGDELAAMKPGALFINVARGGLVDEAALLAALEAGQVGGAWPGRVRQGACRPAVPVATSPQGVHDTARRRADQDHVHEVGSGIRAEPGALCVGSRPGGR